MGLDHPFLGTDGSAQADSRMIRFLPLEIEGKRTCRTQMRILPPLIRPFGAPSPHREGLWGEGGPTCRLGRRGETAPLPIRQLELDAAVAPEGVFGGAVF